MKGAIGSPCLRPHLGLNVGPGSLLTKIENEEEESSKDIRQRAAEIREKNLKKNGGTYTPLKMKKLLEEMLGTYKIDECEDDEAILSFIVKMTETEEAA